MKDFDLPALEYCSLDRASRLLGCELGDLLHWAELSAIPLMIKFTHKVSSDARIMFSDNIDLYKCLRDIDPGDGDFHVSQLCSFSLSPDDYEDYEFEETINPVHNMIEFELECKLHGLWELFNFSIEDDVVKFTALKPFRNQCNWVSIARYWDGTEFTVSDLYISRESIEVITGIKQRVLLSIANFESEYKPVVMVEDINPKTRNYRAAFIKSLLYVCYGKEVADNPRKFFDNPRSKIKIDFDKAGISLPSGKAIDNWLKDIDLNHS
ncbi:hypothetical protein NLN90_22730 [Citrobacter portucalensis]|uniref:hypothetical protein n=1 Tax=Citrobacter portucalensis TaxID=1639133 RepID=UPI00226B4E1B|nr:hypothetical protein [Citrobacter portucalensis]MCX9058832.1 hypothetical protein [Citrobacter portucalensis]